MTAASERQPQPIFLLGAPRSGTTLVQRLLNSYPDITIWGEHAGFLRGLAEAFFQGWESDEMFREHNAKLASDPTTSWQGWMNAFSRADWVAQFRRLLEGLWLRREEEGQRHWGFKEIRYGARPGDRTLDLLDVLYPDALYVFIVRNPYNVVASLRSFPGGWGTRATLKQTCDEWLRRYTTYRAWQEGRRARCYWVVYEELLERRGAMLDLLDRLGKSFGPDQEAVLASKEGRQSSFATDAFNTRWHALPIRWRRVMHAVLARSGRTFGYEPPPLTATQRLRGKLTLFRMELRAIWRGRLRATGLLLRRVDGS